MSTDAAAPSTNPEVEQKIAVAKQKKDVGDQAFKNNDFQKALLSYHEALLYLHGLHKDPLTASAPPIDAPADQPKPKTEADEILEKIYGNQSACHIKKGNWKRALETADKSLAKNADQPKVLFRKAKALGELGYFEKAEKILNDLLEKEGPDTAGIKAELDRLRALDKEREKKHNQKFKGFLNKDRSEKSEKSAEPEPASVASGSGSAAVEGAFIEEVSS